MALFDHSEEPQNLQVDEVGQAYLLETARWGTFIAIIGFIIAGLLVLLGFFVMVIGGTVGSMSKAYSGLPIGFGFLGFIYIIFAGIYFFPSLKLINFSAGIKRSLPIKDQDEFNAALSKLKSLFKLVGILIIIMISFYILILIFAIVVGVVSNV